MGAWAGVCDWAVPHPLPWQFGRSPLYFASKNWQVDAIKALLAAGADVHQCDYVADL